MSSESSNWGPVLIASLLVSCLVLAFSGLGGPPNAAADASKELTQIQSGNATVTVNSGLTSGSLTIAYSPAFASQPRMWIKPTSVIIGPSVVVRQPNALNQFLSGPTTTWIGMPAVDTEVFGDVNGEHRITVQFPGVAGFTFRFGVRCVVSSSNPGAYLTIEYLSGGAWVELNSGARNVIDGSGVSCPPPAANDGEISACVSLPVVSGPVVLRVAGVGGGGIGDNPSFSQLWMDMSSGASCNAGTTILLSTVGSWRACTDAGLSHCLDPQDTSKTGFIIQVLFPVVLTVTTTFKFTWTAGVPA